MASLIDSFLNYKNDNATCLCFENKTFSYKETKENIRKMIQYFLSLNIKAKDVVTLALPNIPQMVFALYALDTIGATINIVHPFTKRMVLFSLMKQVNSKVLITAGTKYLQEDYKDITILVANPLQFTNNPFKFVYDHKLKKTHCLSLDVYVKCKGLDFEVYKRKEREDAILLSSSGTTGIPKVVRLSIDALLNCSKQLPYITCSNLENKSMLAALPIFHCFGLVMGIVGPIYNHMSIALLIRFKTNKLVKHLNKGHINFIIGVPRMYEKLYDYNKFKRAKLNYLELCFVGGDRIVDEFVIKFDELLVKKHSTAKLLQGYGLTEALVCVVNNKENHKLGSLGLPMKGNEIFIVDENDKILPSNQIGEIVIKTHSIMNGYYDDEDISYKHNENTIKTGDLGYIDDEGYLFYKERKKRLFKISGVNVFPKEVENIVLELKEIKEAAVIFSSVPKAHTILIVVANNPKTSHNKLETLIHSYLEKRVIRYSLPKEIIFVEELPKNALGKTNYFALESKYSNKFKQ